MIKKKLIEVALPLEAINRESAREKSIRHGHPSTLHLWWARRPLAACRAVLFASLVDDPSSHPDRFPTEEAQEKERQRLFCLIEELVKWENSNNEEVLARARSEILDSTDGNPPPVYDPFCGGGSIPLEAQRLGLKAYASDLNPVAVLITKAMIEIPARFKNRPPVHPNQEPELIAKRWRGAEGLAEDIRYYSQWIRGEAFRRIGHLYPKVTLPEDQGGGEATVIAWLWARTVTCPNPACGAEMPLVRSFELSRRADKKTWIEPLLGDPSVTSGRVRFEVRRGQGNPQVGTADRRGAKCASCGAPVPLDYIRSEGRSVGLGSQLMAIVAEGEHGRAYLSPSQEQVRIAEGAQPNWVPDTDLPKQALGFRVQNYGLRKHTDLFTSRQLVALTTFADLVGEALKHVEAAAASADFGGDANGMKERGNGARAYAEAVATYLALAVDRMADRLSAICSWDASRDNIRNTFARQAIPMVWDYAEGNPFSDSTGNFLGAATWVQRVIQNLNTDVEGYAFQRNAQDLPSMTCTFSTDPPYYDNVPYADLSDFFYIWLRNSLKGIHDSLLGTVLVPKDQELIADPFRSAGGKADAEKHFRKGLRNAFCAIRSNQSPDYPLTVYYAFKQAETQGGSDNGEEIVASTGWEAMLEALISAGFSVLGTWPIRTELLNRPRGQESNALASSIVLVCRKQSQFAASITRREYLKQLKQELPIALKRLQKRNIAPVDLAQSAIGPGMAVFSRFAKVLEADGSVMTVRTALALINQILDEVLTEQEGEFDPETRWAIAWFQQFGMEEGPFGVAETLSKAKVVSVAGLQESGILTARSGKVRLLERDKFPESWQPAQDTQPTVWEIAQHFIRLLDAKGEQDAARLRATIGVRAEAARDLAYRLYSICERKGWPQEALAYNSLITAWPEISRLALSNSRSDRQRELGY